MTDAVWAFLAASLGVVTAGYPILTLLRRIGVRQTVSVDAPARHQGKSGTPTMGGLAIMVGLTIAFCLGVSLRPWLLSGLPVLLLTWGFALIGFVDDLLIVNRGRSLGLRAREKLALQFAGAVAFAYWLSTTARPGATTLVMGHDLGVLYYAGVVLLIVLMSNAVNLADGLDSLAAGLAASASLGLAAWMAVVSSTGELAAWPAALAGACLGFVWFNGHPAQVFMGDTGALALGAGLAGVAIVGKAEAPLQVGALVLWAELLSVVVQVVVFKTRKWARGEQYAQAHRVFRRTPLHHHFEELGWPETRIVTRFVAVAAVCACLMVVIF